MVYRFSIPKNPLAILRLVIGLILILAGISALIFLGFPFNIVLAALALYLAYSFFKHLHYQIKSRIITYDDGVSAITALGEKIAIPWNLITHAGRFTLVRNKQAFFLYAESTDQLLTFPEDYRDFRELIEEVETHIALPEIHLDSGQSLTEYLRALVLPEETE